MCLMTITIYFKRYILSMGGDDEDLLAFLQSFGFTDENLNVLNPHKEKKFKNVISALSFGLYGNKSKQRD